MPLTTADFDFPLDPALIAQAPAARRDQSRLMVLDRRDGSIRHATFADINTFLSPGDLLVLNDTRVIPAKFMCYRQTGGRIEGLFLTEHKTGRWEVMLKGAARCQPGQKLSFDADPAISLVLLDRLGQGRWLVSPDPPAPAESVLDRVGATPLPPYIHRDAAGAADPADRSRYQTVYAARSGAVAAPTAGLHFTPELLARLSAAGIATAPLTLHVGLGTFAPVKVYSLASHKMHSEWFDLPASTAARVNAAKAAHRRVVAVGTTSVRVLETAARAALPLAPASGWTDIFIYPPADFLAVDALITNFHLPRSTLLMLVAAFCSPGQTTGRDMILSAYATAASLGYRFYSYGDAMLIL